MTSGDLISASAIRLQSPMDSEIDQLVAARNRRKQLVEAKLLEREEEAKKLSPSTVGLINKAKWLLILYIVSKISYSVIKQFLARVQQSKINKL